MSAQDLDRKSCRRSGVVWNARSGWTENGHELHRVSQLGSVSERDAVAHRRLDTHREMGWDGRLSFARIPGLQPDPFEGPRR